MPYFSLKRCICALFFKCVTPLQRANARPTSLFFFIIDFDLWCQRYQLLIVMGYYALRILPFCSPCRFFFTPFQLDNICRAVFNLAWPLVDPSPLLCFLGRACARAPGPCGYSLLCSRGKITTFEVNCALLLQNRARAPLYAWISHIPNSEREFLLFETHTCVSLVCICVCVCVLSVWQ